MRFKPVVARTMMRRALIPILLLAACERNPLVPDATPAGRRAQADAGASTQLAYWNFNNGTAPTSVNSSLVAVTNVTKQLGVGVADLGTQVDNFGDWIIRFMSGVYEPTPVANYSAYRIGIRRTSSCAVYVTGMSFELEHNVVGRPTLEGILEIRSGSNGLMSAYHFTMVGGFALNNPTRLITIPIHDFTLMDENVYFQLRMNEDIWGTESQYTAQLFMDEVSFEGRRNCAPTVSITGPVTSVEGSEVTFTADATDPDGSAVTTTWSFGDGSPESASSSHTYTDNGTYIVSATTTDGVFAASANWAITVSNAAPVVSAIDGATIFVGERYSASGTFSDAGADTHTATVDFGSGPSPLSLSAGGFSISSVYTVPGSYAVNVVVTDDDGAAATTTATVTVLSAARAAEATIAVMASMLPANLSRALSIPLKAVAVSLDRGNVKAARTALLAFDVAIQAALRFRQIDVATHATLAGYSRRIRASIG